MNGWKVNRSKLEDTVMSINSPREYKATPAAFPKVKRSNGTGYELSLSLDEGNRINRYIVDGLASGNRFCRLDMRIGRENDGTWYISDLQSYLPGEEKGHEFLKKNNSRALDETTESIYGFVEILGERLGVSKISTAPIPESQSYKTSHLEGSCGYEQLEDSRLEKRLY